MSSNWWDGPERGPNRDWRNQKGWGKTRPGPYEGKYGKTEDISEDEEIQRPKKGKGKKPQEKKGGELPELSWSDGKKPEWDKPPKKDGQTPDPNRAMVLLEEIEGPKKGKILLISWESKRWTLPSKALDSRDNLLGFAEMPNLPEWKILARKAIREWTGIELKHRVFTNMVFEHRAQTPRCLRGHEIYGNVWTHRSGIGTFIRKSYQGVRAQSGILRVG